MDFRPEIVLTLGTGLGDFVNDLDVKLSVPYKDIEGGRYLRHLNTPAT